ncbi:MAG: hypothetical protein Q8K32_05730 [Archangium sp.]|nr:hypothetical protein [Archangium sp.]
MQAAMGTANLATGLGVDGLVARDVAGATPGSQASHRILIAATTGAAILSLWATVISTLVLRWYLPSVSIFSWPAALALGCGAGLSVLASNYRAVLSGLGAAREIAIGTIVAAVLSLLGAAGLAWAPPSFVAISAAVAVVPLSTMIGLGIFALRRVPSGAARYGDAIRDVLQIARRATIFTAAGVLPLLGQAMVRTLAATHLTEAGLGQMQAAAAIAAISTSVLAGTVGPVLIPQLSSAVVNKREFSTLLSQHTTFLVALYAPVALIAAAAPGVVLNALYANDFQGGAAQLGWQLAGEAVRLPVWLMATTLVVLGRGRAYFVLEFMGLTTQFAGMLFVLPSRDPALIGMVFAASTFAQFVLASFLLRADGFAWSAHALGRIALLAGACCLLATLVGSPWGTALGLIAAAPAVVIAFRLFKNLRRHPAAEA